MISIDIYSYIFVYINQKLLISVIQQKTIPLAKEYILLLLLSKSIYVLLTHLAVGSSYIIDKQQYQKKKKRRDRVKVREIERERRGKNINGDRRTTMWDISCNKCRIHKEWIFSGSSSEFSQSQLDSFMDLKLLWQRYSDSKNFLSSNRNSKRFSLYKNFIYFFFVLLFSFFFLLLFLTYKT